MDRPDTPSMVVTGPFIGAYAADAPGAPRWVVSAHFTDEHEAQGFAVWCQTQESHMVTTGPPLVTWEEVDHLEPTTEHLPPEDVALIVREVEATTNRSTGQGRVHITYQRFAKRIAHGLRLTGPDQN